MQLLALVRSHTAKDRYMDSSVQEAAPGMLEEVYGGASGEGSKQDSSKSKSTLLDILLEDVEKVCVLCAATILQQFLCSTRYADLECH